MTDDDLLTPRPVAANDALRVKLLDRTGRRVRFAGRVRLAARGAVCLLCFAAGLGVAWWQPVAESQSVSVVVRRAPVVEVQGSTPAVVERVPSPAELELEAEKSLVKSESARRFREAGDRYLRDYADYRAALRCYRNFLDEAEAEQLRIAPDDTWLLTSLKRAREQENTQ
jgi:hypothetical protein